MDSLYSFLLCDLCGQINHATFAECQVGGKGDLMAGQRLFDSGHSLAGLLTTKDGDEIVNQSLIAAAMTVAGDIQLDRFFTMIPAVVGTQRTQLDPAGFHVALNLATCSDDVNRAA